MHLVHVGSSHCRAKKYQQCSASDVLCSVLSVWPNVSWRHLLVTFRWQRLVAVNWSILFAVIVSADYMIYIVSSICRAVVHFGITNPAGRHLGPDETEEPIGKREH